MLEFILVVLGFIFLITLFSGKESSVYMKYEITYKEEKFTKLYQESDDSGNVTVRLKHSESGDEVELKVAVNTNKDALLDQLADKTTNTDTQNERN